MLPLKVIFEDPAMIIVNKPAGLISVPTDTQRSRTLADILSSKFNVKLERGGLVHRLDKDTSGVIIVAKDRRSFNYLQVQFKQRKVKKEYLALVHGIVEKEGRVQGAVGRNPKVHNKFGIFEDIEGRKSETEYNPIENFNFPSARWRTIFNDLNQNEMKKLEKMGYSQFTLVSCKPLTGRTHQIRVHLKYINHPIVADEVYVGRKTFRLDIRWCPRQFLHAKKIGFYHPKSGEWVEFEAELADDLKEALDRLT